VWETEHGDHSAGLSHSEHRVTEHPADERSAFLSYNPLMIAKELLEILVCPACKQALEYRQSPESLKCVGCHRVYAVKDDIPIMLIDESTIEPV
jgi:uncharacterized protein YbaR (Trm112 family)